MILRDASFVRVTAFEMVMAHHVTYGVSDVDIRVTTKMAFDK